MSQKNNQLLKSGYILPGETFYKVHETTDVGKDIEKREGLHSTGGNVNQNDPQEKRHGEFSENQK